MSPGHLLTAGHGTAGREALTELLHGAGVRRVVDVRRFPGSRRNPDVGSDAMSEWLPEADIAYRWEPRLGGRRRLPEGQDPAVDAWWQVTAFRAYAAHTRTDEFRAAMADLVREVQGQPDQTVLVLCSESLWWRCHRRLVADVAVLLHRLPVLHLAHNGSLTPHEPSAGAEVTADGLRYDTPAA